MLVRKAIQTFHPGAAVLLFILIAVARVLPVDWSMPQGFDEPCHLAAGIKWLDQHDYTLDVVHPPLARYAIALPLYLSGERLPQIRPHEAGIQAYCTELGNTILSSGGHYTRNLFLARVGILPFLCVAAVAVFLWAGQEFGAFAGCVAAFLLLTLPSVLAFSSLAYTDLPTMCTQFACLFAFAVWLKRPALGPTIFLGIAAGLAFSSKLTSFLFLPLACTAMLLVKVWLLRDRIGEFKVTEAARLLAAACIAVVILWSSYAFSTGHLQEALGETSAPSSSSVANSRGPGSGTVQKLVLADPVIPAPDLVRGFAKARAMNQQAPESYLLGRKKSGGWWYFFPLALVLKTPLAFLILAVLGFLYSVKLGRQRQWPALLPAAAVAGIFVATIFVTLRVGTRHVLVVLPLLSLLAGFGAASLWRIAGPGRLWGRLALSLLLAWHTAASIRAQGDFLAYFNELAPTNPGGVLVKGCDSDCGQDVFRLSRELRARGVTKIGMGICSSANMALIDLPPLYILQPHKSVTGWVAVSLRALKTGQFKIIEGERVSPNEDYPDDALSWLEKYRPVARVGQTILLYDIPEITLESSSQARP